MKTKLFLSICFLALSSAFAKAQPSNDFIDGAIEVVPSSSWSCMNSTSATVSGATDESVHAPITCNGYVSSSAKDVWYKFTAIATDHEITVEGSSSFDAIVALYSESQSGQSIALMGCADNYYVGGTEVIEASGLNVNATYYVRVYHYGSSIPSTPTFTICVTSPNGTNQYTIANDEYTGANHPMYQITPNAQSSCLNPTLGSVTNATQESAFSPISCNTYTSPASNDVWYTFAASSTNHDINVEGSSNFDAVVGLYESANNGISLIACADANGAGATEVINATGLNINSTYFVRIYHYGSSIPNTPTFNICITTPNNNQPPAPSNDERLSATQITPSNSTSCVNSLVGDIAGANQENAPTWCNNYYSATALDVWYKFIPTSTKHTITVDGSSNFDAVVELYAGNATTPIECANATDAGGIEVITATGLNVGLYYRVRVYHYAADVNDLPSTRTFDICITTPNLTNQPNGPLNDEFDGAYEVIPSNTSTCVNPFSGNVSDATQEQGFDPKPCNNFTSSTANDVWYKFYATSTQHDITVAGSAFMDAVVFLHEGTENVALEGLGNNNTGVSVDATALYCADEFGAGGKEVIHATGLTVNNLYFVRIYHYGNSLPLTTSFDVCITPINTSNSSGGQKTVGIEENNNNGILSAYPNPTSTELTISFESVVNTQQPIEVMLISVDGKVVYSERAAEFNDKYTKTLNVADLTNGIYLLQVITEKNSIVKKVVKK